ncbi:MAG: glutaminase [Pseudomonadota bacterium]
MAREAFEAAKPLRGKGRVADYIPALAKIDPMKLGLAIALPDGSVIGEGDCEEPFSIQSVSKVFTLALALEKVGDTLWDCVGREPSGSPFNSIVQLESENGIPRNPLINAGAIAVTDRLIGDDDPDEVVERLVAFMAERSGNPAVGFDPDVARSESETGSRNRSLAHFMAAFNNLTHDAETALSVYFRQCALAMSCSDLARAALFLANGGVDPRSGTRIISETRGRRINAVMLTCGHYDNSGDFAFRVGLPGKSGVGGGILVIAPGRGAIVAWSPGLNKAGTSLAGSAALEHFAAKAGWSVFN